MSDLIFRGATVIDGTGAAGFTADVSVVDGHIDEVGALGGASATTVVDARGLVLSPGFIDLHTHSDFTLTRFPRALTMTAQGVTTQLTGNCGFSPFPVLPHRSELLREYSGFLDAGLPWGTWHTAAEFLAILDGLPLSGNVACQVGHGSVRMAAMGFDTGEPAPDQLDAMSAHVADAMAAGAFGISSGLTYAPASAATTDELVAVAKAAAEAGGFYSTHIRSEATTLVEAVTEALDVGRRAGLPVQISHHKVMGRANWPKVTETLALVDAASAAGLDVGLDQYPYTAGSTGLAVVLPRWALVGGVAKMRERLADPAQRAAIRAEIAAQRPEDLRAGLRVFEPDTVVIAEAPDGPLTAYVGLTLTEVARARGQDPVDTALDLLAEAGGEILTIVHGQSEENLRRIMRHPLTAIASDGWTLSPEAGGRPHPRSYGTYARVLGRYVREEGVLGLEEAVRKMTSLPARRLGLTDRGVLRPGAAADLVLFDPASVTDNATFADPHRFCDGVRTVVVNGVIVVSDGEDTGAVAGTVLRRPGKGAA
ncbi:MAG TPA: D-aminoacylase [Amycolatopsis sp.]|nr:D-aminoacylase [Amycolatopsis sp.]